MTKYLDNEGLTHFTRKMKEYADGKASEVDIKVTTHVGNKQNPHGVTKVQVGLGSVDNVQQIPLSQKGFANGVATLDAKGKVPVEQMPTTKTINGASIFGSGNLQLSASPGGSIIVDTELIENSSNPVAGGVVKAKIDEIDTKLANWQGVDDEPTAGSDNLVKSGGVFDAISKLAENIGPEIIGGVTTNYQGNILKANYNLYNHPLEIKGDNFITLKNKTDRPYLAAGTYTFNVSMINKVFVMYRDRSSETSFNYKTVDSNNKLSIPTSCYVEFIVSYNTAISTGFEIINDTTSEVVYKLKISEELESERVDNMYINRNPYKKVYTIGSTAYVKGDTIKSFNLPSYKRLDFILLHITTGSVNGSVIYEISDGENIIESKALSTQFGKGFLILYNRDYEQLTVTIKANSSFTADFKIFAFYDGKESEYNKLESQKEQSIIIYQKSVDQSPALVTNGSDGIEYFQVSSMCDHSIQNTRVLPQDYVVKAGGSVPLNGGAYRVKAFDKNFKKVPINVGINTAPRNYNYFSRDENKKVFWIVGDSLSDRGGWRSTNGLSYYSFAKQMNDKYGYLFSFNGLPVFGQTTAQQIGNLNYCKSLLTAYNVQSGYTYGIKALDIEDVVGIFIYIGTNDIDKQTNIDTFEANYTSLITLAREFTSAKIMVVVPPLCCLKDNAADYCNKIKEICDGNNVDYVDLSVIDSLNSLEHGQSDVYYEPQCIHFTQHAWENIINPLCFNKFEEIFNDSINNAIIESKLETLENKTIDVDAELKDSPNPVQNRAVNAAVLNLNTEIGKKANSTDLNAATGKITTLETNAATILSVTGEGNGISSISKSGNTITATKGNFLTSAAGLATTVALNDGLAGKADVNHNHDTKYAAKEHTHPEYAQSSALNDYVTKTALDGKNFLTNTALNGYVNEVQPDGTSGNGIANITKEGKVLKVTKSTFLTEHQSLADYATQAWVNEQGFATGTIPTKTSELNNDSGFLTQHQSLDGYVNNVKVTGVANGNGIASIAKNGKDINVTQGAFLTAIDGIIAETGEAVAGRGVVNISIRGNKLVKKTGTFVTPATLGDAIDNYASNKGYLTENNLNEKLKETVTIKLVSDKSASDTNLNGATITVKSGDTTVSTQTWQGTPINVKVPCDKEVTIETSLKKMYIKPKALKYVPSPLYNREVVFTYKALETGVFIIDKNDNIYKTTNDFEQSGVPFSDAVGAALVTDKTAIVIAGNIYNTKWSNKNGLIDGCTVAASSSEAAQDFAGAANTAAIIKANAGLDTAASKCNNYVFINGKKGHLMSAGEAIEIQKNFDSINSILRFIDPSNYLTENDSYWTSTQKDSDVVWGINMAHSTLEKYFITYVGSSTLVTNKAFPIYSLYD